MKSLWAELRIAGSFLTRFPVAQNVPCDGRRLGRSMAFFPLVGLLLGVLLVAADKGLALLFPRSVADGVLLLLLVLATGGLHLDGLADTVDGLAGGRDRETALRIMKDSRVGAMGAIVLTLTLLLKYLALHALPGPVRSEALLLFPAAGRWATVALAAFSPYVRPGGGTGAFSDHVGKRELLIAGATVAAAAFLLSGVRGFLLLPPLVLAAAGLCLYFRKKLGGVTGDVLGASVEIVEVFTLMLFLSFFAARLT